MRKSKLETIARDELKNLLYARIMLNNLKIAGAKETDIWKIAEEMTKHDYESMIKSIFPEGEAK